MAVYVDDMKARFGRMVMCHMMADSKAELLAMADKIGVQREWIQKEGTDHEHFDICMSKRAAAVRHGANEVAMRDLGRLIHARRTARDNARVQRQPSESEAVRLEPVVGRHSRAGGDA